MSIARQTSGDVGAAWTRRDLFDGQRLPAVARVLVVADEPNVLEAISLGFRDVGFEVAVAASGASALRGLEEAEFDLVVLDGMLPDASGIDLLREVRATGDVPVILLGAGHSEAERILGLELGADDYVTKPFSPLELASRGRAILRRARRQQHPVEAVREVGLLRIDSHRHQVMLGERPIEITASEFRVLALVASSPGKVFTRRQIMEHVWGGPYFGDGHPVDMHVLNLRRKIEADPTRPRRLLNVRGVGFKLVAPACEGA